MDEEEEWPRKEEEIKRSLNLIAYKLKSCIYECWEKKVASITHVLLSINSSGIKSSRISFIPGVSKKQSWKIIHNSEGALTSGVPGKKVGLLRG